MTRAATLLACLALALGACDSSDGGDGKRDGATGSDSAVIEAGGSTDGATGDSAAGDSAVSDSALGDSASSDGATSDAASGDSGPSVPCDPSVVTCRSLPPNCPVGEIPTVVNSCWGKCVPIGTCSDVPAQPDCGGQITCKRAEPTCPKGYVPSIINQCYGPCVPKHTCACKPGGPATQCPKDTVCWTRGRCGPLV